MTLHQGRLNVFLFTGNHDSDFLPSIRTESRGLLLRLVFVLSPIDPTGTVHTSLGLLTYKFAAVATFDLLLDDIIFCNPPIEAGYQEKRY